MGEVAVLDLTHNHWNLAGTKYRITNIGARLVTTVQLNILRHGK
jgi:hypothetical protein